MTEYKDISEQETEKGLKKRPKEDSMEYRSEPSGEQGVPDQE